MISIEFDRAAHFRRSVLICVDKAYEPYSLLLIEQILENSAKIDFDVCLIAPHEISVPIGLRHLPIRVGKLTTDFESSNFPRRTHVGFVGYFPIFATSVLEADYERILLLDADMLFLGNDLTELFDIELCPGHAVGAVRDMFQQRNLRARPKESKKMGIGHFPYFNSGVVLIDIEKWIETNLYERLLATIRNQSDSFAFTDQSAWNITLQGEWSELSWLWNWTYRHYVSSQLPSVDPQIVHFPGLEKPWIADLNYHPKQFVEVYEAFLRKHYERPLLPLNESNVRLKKRPAIYLKWLDLTAKWKLRKYCRRISDPLKAINPHI